MNDYRFVLVREVGLSGSPDAGLTHPIPAESKNEIVLEPRDGPRVARHPVKAITLLRKEGRAPAEVVVKPAVLPLQLILTDARVAVACSKYDQGSTWLGTPGLANLALNLGSKALAAKRRRGSMLVGHARYSWLAAVRLKRRKGSLLDYDELRLVLTVAEPALLEIVDLVFPKSVDSGHLTADIVRRTATYQLAHNDAATSDARVYPEKPGEREALRELQALEFSDVEPGKSVTYSFPNPLWICKETARLGAWQ